MYKKEKRIHLMGTVIDILIEHENADVLVEEVVRRLKVYEKRYSANDNESELMQVNLNAEKKAIKVNSELYQLIKLGKHHSCANNSHLNIAIGPLVQAWRIGFDDARVPTNKEITDLLEKTDPEKIILNDKDQSVFLKEKDMFIDLGALAKGYIADLIIEFLKSENVTTALINLGGNIVGLGPNDEAKKKNWKIGIQDPNSIDKQHLMILKIKNQSIVTSGIYERSYESDGKTYHHILDPKTGYPIDSDVASLTIVSKKSVDGEVWTTRLFGKTSQEIIEELEQINDIDGLVITKEGNILNTKGLEKIILKKKS